MASIGAGILHVSAAADHVDMPVMRAGFLVVAVLQIGLGAFLLRRLPGWRLTAAAVALMLSSVALWIVSRTAGLPLVPDAHVEPVGLKDAVTVLFELAALRGLLLIAQPSPARPRASGRALGAMGLATAALLTLALVAGGGPHSHPAHDTEGVLGSAQHVEGGHDPGSGTADDRAHGRAPGDDHHGSEGPGGAADTPRHAGAGHSDHSGGTTQLAALGTGGGHGHGTQAGDHGDSTHRGRAPRHRSHRNGERHRKHPARRPGGGHGHGRGKGKGDGEHHHEHPPEPEQDGPLRQLADVVASVGIVPPQR
jgi:hypothetical protein